MAPLVTCIIPVFDGERFLAEAVESVLAQSWTEIEVLVVDDASTDSTPEIADAFGEPVRRIRLAENRGPAAARNRGLDKARGDFVAFLDADDRWLPAKLERQMARMPDLDLCFTAYQNFWEAELADEAEAYRDHALSRPMRTFCISTLLTRPAEFARTGRFDESRRFGENMPLFMAAHRMGLRVEVMSDVLAERRFHGGSLTREDPQRNRLDFLDILKDWRDGKRDGEPS
ncbi:MAG: glycosyltransferase family 2 protein [Gemmatimonadetes bacterium]|nr:glycosyltransferase family 2 protein [Gemmatimonadota bacterium]